MYHAHQSQQKAENMATLPITFLSSVWIDQPAIFSPDFSSLTAQPAPPVPWTAVPQAPSGPKLQDVNKSKKQTMMKQQQSKLARKAKAEETLSILRYGTYTTSLGTYYNISNELTAAINGSKCISPEYVFPDEVTPRFSVMEVEVTQETTMQAAKRLYDEGGSGVGCLCFASGKNPGGAFMGGSDGQEESISRSSGYYHCIMKDTALYDYNRTHKDPFHSDHVIVAPSVPVFRSEASPYHLIAPWYMTVISAPAVNATVARERNASPVVDNLIAQRMKHRIHRILAAAYEAGVTRLVLGEYGCGSLGNDPMAIASYFRDALLLPNSPFAGAFQHVVFAIQEDNNGRFKIPCLPCFAQQIVGVGEVAVVRKHKPTTTYQLQTTY